MDATSRLGHGDALHTVHAGFVLHLRVRAPATDFQDDLPEAADVGRTRGEHLDLPALPFGVALVHLHDLACEQRRLLPTGPGSDLHHDVLVVVGVLRDHQRLEPLAKLGRAAIGRLGFGPELGRERGVLLLPRHLPPLRGLALGLADRAVGSNEVLDLGMLLAEIAQAGRVRGDLGA